MRALIAIVLVTLGISSSACAQLLAGPVPGSYRTGRFMPPPDVNPIGRWYAVMELEPRSLVGLLHADGTRHTGRFVGASLDAIRIFESGREIEIPRDDVVRLELLTTPAGGRVKDVAAGAAAGALVFGATESLLVTILGGKFAWPSGRTLAAGAATGAIGGLVDGAARSGQRTIYISPSAVR